jgi:hypothetical protein
MFWRPSSKPRATERAIAGTFALLAGAALAAAPASTVVDTLRAVGGLPAHIAGQFREPIGFAVTASGEYIVLDKRAHTVYAVDETKREVRRIIQIGFEEGRLLGPAVLSLGQDGIFAVADGPQGAERIQYFSLDGTLLGGFYLGRLRQSGITAGPFTANGIDSMQFTGRSFLLSRPGLGAPFSEYDLRGGIIRHIGNLRPTGHEDDPEVHQALNSGLPLVDPTGGFFFVFHSGRPMFRKYDAEGVLLYERHIEGPELDAAITRLPTTWPERDAAGGHRPVVEPLVRTAAVDAAGRLWVSLVEPVTYVYAPDGSKIRTVELAAAGLIAPTSLFFTPSGRLLVTPGCYEFQVD